MQRVALLSVPLRTKILFRAMIRLQKKEESHYEHANLSDSHR